MRPTQVRLSEMPGGKCLHCAVWTTPTLIRNILDRQSLCELDPTTHFMKDSLVSQMGWWGDLGGPKQRGIIQYGAHSKHLT